MIASALSYPSLMSELLQDIVLLSFFALISAATTYFLDFCIGSPSEGEIRKGRIFGAYGLWIYRKYNEREEAIKKSESLAISNSENEIEYCYQPTAEDKARIRRKHLSKVRRVNYYKALGICYVCWNVWISFIYFGILSWILPLSPVEAALYLIPFVVLANLIVRKLF